MAVLTLFLCGDVMAGRGIDQILQHPSAPEIHEPYVRDSRDYVDLAEQASGPIARPVAPSYIWGDALGELEQVSPQARIVNLETSVTRSDDYWVGKGINYRMHPENIACLTAAAIDVCALANNHILDYGYEGLKETLEGLTGAGLRCCGAGSNLAAARRPAIIDFEDGRLLVWSVGMESSGIPPEWAATTRRAGVDFLETLSDETADALAGRFLELKQPGDIGVISIHWDSNWGYDVPSAHVRFAHRLIEDGIDLIHGHSSHHPRPVEIYRERLILYGCGDFINDHEGIGGYEQYRGDLALMYFADVESATGRLQNLRMTPMRQRKLKLQRATTSEAEWVRASLERASTGFGSRLELEDGRLALRPSTPLAPRRCSGRR